MNLNQAPILKALIPFILGILFNVYIGFVIPTFFLIACTLPLVWLLLQILWPHKFVTWNNRWTTGIAIYTLAFICGYAITHVRSEITDKRHFSKVDNATLFIGVVDQQPIEKKKSYQTVLQITEVKSVRSWHNTIGQCIIYFKKDSASVNLHYGDLVAFTSQPVDIKLNGDSIQRSYTQYLIHHNIYHRSYVKSNEWTMLGHHEGNSLIEKALAIRSKLLEIFKKNGVEGQDYAVLSALTLGDESNIDKETMNAFAATGTIHILSVSGMHVGIIFVVLDRLLFFMNRKRATKILKAIILIFFLGSYALLAGLSPPVLRSAAMLGLVVLGMAIDRQKNSWNIIAASGLILLCWNPMYIMDAGFQLSYLSVIGIILLYEKIFNLFDINNLLLREIWSMVSVSLAAEITTFPLMLYYFHRFPNYFILSNLVILHLSAAIIYGGLLLLLISPWTAGALLLGKLVALLVHVLNTIALWIEHLPYAVTGSVFISVLDTCLIYIAIVLSVLFLFKKQPRFLIASLSTLCAMLCIQIIQLI